MRWDRSLLVNVLLALAAFGTFGVVLATRDEPTTEELERRAGNLFPTFSRARLNRVEARGETGAFTLAIDPSPDGGEPSARLVAPAEAAGAADAEAAEALARALETAAFLRRFEAEAVDRRALGLEPPRAELQVAGTGFESTLLLGKAAATPAGTIYVEVRGGASEEPVVGLVRDDLARQLFLPADALRPRALSSLGPSDLSALSFEDDGLRVALKRKVGPVWIGADGERVSRDAVERLVLELSRVKAERFLNPKDTPLTASALRARFVPARGAPLAFRIGGACPDAPDRLVLVRETPVTAAFCVTRTTRGIFADVAETLADTAPFVLRADEVETLLIEQNHEKLELRRSERGFRLLAPTTADVELEAGNQRLETLTRARGERLRAPDLGALGLTPPVATVRLVSTVIEGTPRFEEVLELGRAGADGRLPVRRRDDGTVLLLSRDAARATAIDTTLLRSRELSNFSPSAVQELSVEMPGERQRLRRSAAGLELVEPRGPGHDAALALDLLQTLGTLRAERWVADRDDGSFGLTPPRIVVRARLEAADAGARDFGLRVGAATPGGAYAMLEGVPGVFLVSKAVEIQLTTLVLSRDGFGSDPDSIAAIELEKKERRLRLERRGNEFQAKPATAMAESNVERLVRAVAALRPEAAIHTGPARNEEGFQTPTLVVRVTSTQGRAAKTLRIGAGDTFRERKIFYARVDGTDATYALAQSEVRELIDTW